jgi:hypothetical protein
MNESKNTAGMAIATAVIALFAAGCSSADDAGTGTAAQAQSVKCVGINSCRGTSECMSADGKSQCQGQNACKGQGFVTVPSERECREKGGVLYAEAKASPGGGGASDAGPQTAASVKCEGINTCKGQSNCAGADHACQGKNDCRGKGWIPVPSAADCLSQGGKIAS